MKIQRNVQIMLSISYDADINLNPITLGRILTDKIIESTLKLNDEFDNIKIEKARTSFKKETET